MLLCGSNMLVIIEGKLNCIGIALLLALVSPPILGYQKVMIPDQDVEYLYDRLQTAERMSATDALNTIVELENYYTGAKNGVVGEPSEMIDTAWHAHILNTQMYFSFCQSQFGYYLHHTPSWSGMNADPVIQTMASSPDFQLPMHVKLRDLGLENLNETIWTHDHSVLTQRMKERAEL